MADDKAPAESSTKPEANGAGPSTEQAKPAVEQLGALEEDDEFEEFPVDDWPEQETTLAALTGAAGAQPGAGVGQQLWEDNWDDDDVEVAFTTQLRAELKAQNDGDAAMKS